MTNNLHIHENNFYFFLHKQSFFHMNRTFSGFFYECNIFLSCWYEKVNLFWSKFKIKNQTTTKFKTDLLFLIKFKWVK